MNKLFAVAAVVAVVAGGGAFYGGMQYANMSMMAARQQRFGQNGGSRGFGGGGPGGRGFNGGTIIAKDDKSITIQMQDVGSKIIFYAPSTQVTKFVPGTAEDLAVGKTVVVNGTANSDGSITAEMIQLRPLPGPSVSPSASPASK